MKKGLSPLIGAVLLTLIVLSIALLVIGFSREVIKKQQERAEGFSFYYNAEFFILSDLATLSASGSPDESIILAVRRLDNGGDVFGVRFIFEDNRGNVYTHDIYENPPNNAGIVEQYTIKPSDIKISSFSDIKKISISLLYGINKPTEILDAQEIE